MSRVGYYSSSLGWVNQATNSPLGVFEITSDLDMEGYSITSADNGTFNGNVTAQSFIGTNGYIDGVFSTSTFTTNLRPDIITKRTGLINEEVISTGSRIAPSAYVSSNNIATPVVLTNNEVFEGIITFTAPNTPSSITWPDITDITAIFDFIAPGPEVLETFTTFITNQSGADLPDFTAGTGQSFDDGAVSSIPNNMTHVYLSTIINSSAYSTRLISTASASDLADFKVTGDLITAGGRLDTDGSALNIGTTSAGDINMARTGSNVVINADSILKVNQINPNGAGPIVIDGASLSIYSPGNSVETHVGNVSPPLPTAESLLHIEANNNATCLITAGEDSTGIGTMAIQTKTRERSFDISLNSNGALIFESSSINTLVPSDMRFLTGGTYASIPALDDLAVPTGSIEAMRIKSNGNLYLYNLLEFDGFKYAIGVEGATEAARSHDIAIGFDVETGTGVAVEGENFAIGSGTKVGTLADVTESTAIGSSCSNNGSRSVVIGKSSSNTTNDSIVIGSSAVNTGTSSFCAMLNANNSGDGSILIGNNSTNGQDNSIVIGRDASNSSVNSVSIGYLAANTSPRSVNIGNLCTNSSDYSLNAGYSCTNTATSSVCLGRQSTNNGGSSVVIGYAATNSAAGASSVAIGRLAATSAADTMALGKNSAATAAGAIAIGPTTNNVATSIKLVDNTHSADICGNLKHGSTNNVWSATEAPVVETSNLFGNNATAAKTLSAVETVDGIVLNTHGAANATFTWPTAAQVKTFLENYTQNAPTADTDTLHTTFKTIIVNNTANTVAFDAGANQTAIGASLTSGIGANVCATYTSYITDAGYNTVLTSKVAI